MTSPLADSRSSAIVGSANLFTSSSIGKIVAALIEAQKSMQPVNANALNSDFDHKYSDLGAVLNEVKPALNAQKILLLQPPGAELIEGGLIGVLVETILIHESGEYLGCGLKLFSNKCDAHGFGSLDTYGRRYGIDSLLALARKDDDGKAAVGDTPLTVPAASAPGQPSAANGRGINVESVLAQVRQLPPEYQERFWLHFEGETKRGEAAVQGTDLPLLQLLLARARRAIAQTAKAS